MIKFPSIKRGMFLLRRRFIPQSLFARSLLILIVPAFLTQAIATFIFFDRHWDNMTKRLAEAVAGEIYMIAEHVDEVVAGGEEDSIKFVKNIARSLRLYVSYETGVTDLPKVLPDDRWNSSVIPTVKKALDEQVKRPYNLGYIEDKEWVEIQVLVNDGLLTVQVPEKRLFSSTVYIFLGWMIGSQILLMAIAIIFMRNQIKPIRKLAWAADRFGRGLDVPILKPSGAREVRAAMIAFKEMYERLLKQIEQRTLMLAGVSHDLKTPLTRIRLELSMMDEGEEVEEIKKDLNEMQRMIEGYLSFAQDQSSTTAERVNIYDIIEDLASKYKRMDKALEKAIQKDLWLPLRIQQFERALDNLISNGFKYGQKVWVRAYKLGNFFEITVEDDGPGIPQEKFEEVFKPFYRLDQSRNLDTGGVGLGLSISKDIVHQHGGEIFLENSPKGGLRVVIRLPIGVSSQEGV